jgi:hypothetical protein
MARKAAVRYPDFTIVFRKDRNGYEGWFAGKAEAFRKTAEKVDAFFQKKYAKNGTLVDNVRVYNLPADPQVTAEVKAEPQPKAAKPAKAKPAKPPKAKREAPVLEPEDFEDTDLDPLALL